MFVYFLNVFLAHFSPHIHSTEFHYRTTLDASVSSTMPRLYFLHKEHENEEELVTILSKGQTWCKERQAYFIV